MLHHSSSLGAENVKAKDLPTGKILVLDMQVV